MYRAIKYIEKISAIPNFSRISKFSEILTIVNYETTILPTVRTDPIFSGSRTFPIIYLYSEYRRVIKKKKKKEKNGVDLEVFESFGRQRTFGMCVININLRKVIFKYSLQPQIQKVVENDFYYFLRNFD